MNNEEKAREIADKYCTWTPCFNEYENACLEMAQWKDEQFDLLKWKKATKYKDLKKHVAILEEGKVLLSNYIEKGDYYIELKDLIKLPK